MKIKHTHTNLILGCSCKLGDGGDGRAIHSRVSGLQRSGLPPPKAGDGQT